MNQTVSDPLSLRARLDEAAAAAAPDPFDILRDDMLKALDTDLPIPAAKPAEVAKPAEIAKPAVAATTAVTAAPDRQAAELENFLATGEKLLSKHRRRIITMESEYEIGRTKLLDSFRVRMADLENEANEAIRRYDTDHTTAMHSAKRLEDALLAMRG